ncbi:MULTISPECIES: hypothetical protein [unclassified Variovorax]|uniref:hypothetical protein n=1 Tax=unclassified Variovorax TaxID=663243 RepID=UPI000838E0AE|nr:MULTISPECIES: hypothetical protein [unclassified Variovorax]
MVFLYMAPNKGSALRGSSAGGSILGDAEGRDFVSLRGRFVAPKPRAGVRARAQCGRAGICTHALRLPRGTCSTTAREDHFQ